VLDNPASKHDLRQKAERILADKPGAVGTVSTEDKDRLLHELSVHQIELEMQNEELRRAQVELEASRSRYLALYDYAPVGYLTFDEKGGVSELNLTAAGLLGTKTNFVINKSFAHFVHPGPQDTFYFHRRKVAETVGKHTCELVLKKKNRGFFTAQLESIGVHVDGVSAIHSILTDITDRKRQEEVLRRQADLLELVYSAILVLDPERRITFWNTRAEELYGWMKAEALGSVAHALLKTQFPAPLDECELVLTREGRWEGELVHTTKDGRQITVLSRQAVQRDEVGNPGDRS
jgi:PAS domain S-box-containing protein